MESFRRSSTNIKQTLPLSLFNPQLTSQISYSKSSQQLFIKPPVISLPYTNQSRCQKSKQAIASPRASPSPMFHTPRRLLALPRAVFQLPITRAKVRHFIFSPILLCFPPVRSNLQPERRKLTFSASRMGRQESRPLCRPWRIHSRLQRQALARLH